MKLRSGERVQRQNKQEGGKPNAVGSSSSVSTQGKDELRFHNNEEEGEREEEQTQFVKGFLRWVCFHDKLTGNKQQDESE